MAEEFENLELRDENTGETETFTPVDTTARQQIQELNETLTELNTVKSYTLTAVNEHSISVNNSYLYKCGKACSIFIQLRDNASSGINDIVVTIPEDCRPPKTTYLSIEAADGAVEKGYCYINTSGGILFNATVNSSNILIIGSYIVGK